jgi:DNA helicase IV
MKLQTPNYKHQTTNTKQQTTNYKLQTTNTKHQTTNTKLQTTNIKHHYPFFIGADITEPQELQVLLCSSE